MRQWKGLVVGLLVALMAAGGTIASAQKKEQEKRPDPFEQLDLSGDQKGKLDLLMTERRTALAAGQKKNLEGRKKLVGLLFDKKTPDKEIDQAADQLSKGERELLLADVKFHKALRKILTQEQLTTLSKGGKPSAP